MNKSKIIAALVASVVTASAFSAVAAGCRVDEPYVFEYEVSVVGGTGSGTYKDGDDCSVTAEIPEGKKFGKWVNEYGEVLSTANPYTFKVDGDTEIYAVTDDIATYKIEVIGGTITGTSDYEATVYAGETVSVSAKSSNSHRFKEWLINGTEKSSANPYTFTATQDMKIEAVVDESYLVAVSGGTIEGEEKSSKIFEAGEECTIIAGEAPVAGQDFVYWYVTDEDGNEKFVTFDESHTFAVTGTDKYYAKFGIRRTVTVENGIFDKFPGYATINVVDGDSVTISLDEENIPLTKGFAGWKIDGITVTTDLSYKLTDISDDITVTADLPDKVKYETPEMDANQMFRKRLRDGANDYALEIDRMKNADGSNKTLFTADTDCMAVYIYDSPYADKDAWVGQMRIDGVGGWRIATKDGEKLWNIEGAPGNFWLETNGGFHLGKGTRGNAMDIFKRAIESCGNTYSDDTAYYVSAQIKAKRWSLSGDSEISVIGPQYFIKNDVATHTVNISGATVKGTDITVLTAFEGQTLTLVHEKENFRYWRVNGEIADGATGNELTVTVDGDLTIVAVADEDLVNLSVVGGTIEGSSSTSEERDLGEKVKIIATVPEDKAFDYWYKLDGDNEVIVSRDAEYEFVMTEDVTLYAKLCNLYTVTVTGGYIEGLESEDGTYGVKEGEKITVVLDVDAVPENQGFDRWSTGAETFECTVTVTGDMNIEAEYTSEFIKLAKPVNGNNEMFKVQSNGTIEIDRKNKNVESEFDSAFVDHMRFYFYTRPYAVNTEENAVGYVILQRTGSGKDSKFYFATADGVKLWDVKGKMSDLYHDNAGEAGYASMKDVLFALVESAAGDGFDPDTPYYVAMQSVGVAGSKYSPSDISDIGPQAFIKNNVASYTVSITGGKVKDTDISKLTVYSGQTVTIVPDNPDDFTAWIINGSQREETAQLEITVTENLDIVALGTAQSVTVTVSDPTATETATHEVTVGDDLTLSVANPAEGIVYSWFKQTDGDETFISAGNSITISPLTDMTVTVKVVRLETPEMSANQMFNRNDNYVLELDRAKIDGNPNNNDPANRKSAFVEGVDYVKFYIYTSTDADKSDYVGAFKLYNNGGTFRLATMDGTKLWDVEGAAGNMWLDTKDGYNTDRKGNFFNMMRTVLGENFEETQAYYLAAQACSEQRDKGYNDSEISQIGPKAFQYVTPEVTG